MRVGPGTPASHGCATREPCMTAILKGTRHIEDSYRCTGNSIPFVQVYTSFLWHLHFFITDADMDLIGVQNSFSYFVTHYNNATGAGCEVTFMMFNRDEGHRKCSTALIVQNIHIEGYQQYISVVSKFVILFACFFLENLCLVEMSDGLISLFAPGVSSFSLEIISKFLINIHESFSLIVLLC